MSIWKHCGLVLVLLALATAVAAPARADFVVTLTATVEHQASNTYLYEYDLSNLTQSDTPAINLNIEVAQDSNLQSISGPTGWDSSYMPGNTYISWATSNLQDAIAPGQSAIYSFLTFRAPNSGDYSILGFNSDTFTFDSSSGLIASPTVSSVPEPSSFILLIAPIIVLIVLHYLIVDLQKLNVND